MLRLAAVAALVALLPLPAAAGGKRCQVAESGIPTPGLRGLAMSSDTDPAPAEARLTDAQIDRLAEADTHFRRALSELDERIAGLPVGKAGTPADLAAKPLPEIVTVLIARAVRGRAILIDAEKAGEFRLAREAVIAAQEQGEKSRACPLCIAVRRGMEAGFRYEDPELAGLTEEQKKEIAALGQKRDDLLRKWAAVLKEELTAPQLEVLRDAQMQWLKATLKSAVTDGMAALGDKACAACSKEEVQVKCEFCAIVVNAVKDAARKISR